MPRVDESTLLVQLELQNRSLLTEIKSWEIDSDYLTTTDGFSFTCYSQDPSVVRGLEMQPVELKVSGASQLLGRIEKSTIGDDGSAVKYEGRDYLSDLVECCIDPTVTVKDGMDLHAAITAIAGTTGIDTVVSDSDLALRNIRSGKAPTGGAGREFQSLKAEEIKPEYGEKQLDFISKLVSRHGATVQPANSRNTLLLTSPNYAQTPLYSIRRVKGNGGSGNNVLTATATRDFSSFPTFTIYNGSQTKPAQSRVSTYANMGVGLDTLVDLTKGTPSIGVLGSVAAVLFKDLKAPQPKSAPADTSKRYNTANAAAGFAPREEDTILAACHIGRRKPTDGTGDPLKMYRLLAVRDDRSKNQEQLDRVAAREVGERLKEILVYTVEVQGHVDPISGAIWSVDTMVDVVDEVCDVAEPLWIAQRTLRFDPMNGATTSMTCWRPGAFIT